MSVEKLPRDSKGRNDLQPEAGVSNKPGNHHLSRPIDATGRGSIYEDVLMGAIFSGADAETLGKIGDAIADDLTWTAEGDSPAKINGSSFLNAADRVRHGYSLQEQAEAYHKMFGIPVQEALKRIEIAGKRI